MIDILRSRLAEYVKLHEEMSIELIGLAGAIQALEKLIDEQESPEGAKETAVRLEDLEKSITLKPGDQKKVAAPART